MIHYRGYPTSRTFMNILKTPTPSSTCKLLVTTAAAEWSHHARRFHVDFFGQISLPWFQRRTVSANSTFNIIKPWGKKHIIFFCWVGGSSFQISDVVVSTSQTFTPQKFNIDTQIHEPWNMHRFFLYGVHFGYRFVNFQGNMYWGEIVQTFLRYLSHCTFGGKRGWVGWKRQRITWDTLVRTLLYLTQPGRLTFSTFWGLP